MNVLYLLFAYLFFSPLYNFSQSTSSPKPNVLFVVFDDLNDWEACLSGHPQTITPHIDRLAQKGMLFSNAHANATMCCPSRASFMTGLRPTTTGIYKNTDTPLKLYKSGQTMNKHFKENGYFTAGSGKILHKFYYEESDWDEYEAKHLGKNIITNRQHPHEEKTTKVNGNLAWGGFEAPDSMTFDAQTVNWIIERLERNYNKPFFLACGIFRPHIPWFNPQSYFDQHPLEKVELPTILENDLNDIPLQGKHIAHSLTNFTLEDDLMNRENIEHQKIVKDELWKAALQGYLASVSYADAQFGRLLDALEQSPYSENTIVVLLSDHGYHLGEKNHWRKGTLWERVTHVPLIFYVPESLLAGSLSRENCAQPVSLLDIYPTLIELCELSEVKGLEGESLVPQLKNPRAPKKTPVITSLTPDYHAIRTQEFRYISYGKVGEELYNHYQDPEEWTNLAGDSRYFELKKELRRFLPQNSKAP